MFETIVAWTYVYSEPSTDKVLLLVRVEITAFIFFKWKRL